MRWRVGVGMAGWDWEEDILIYEAVKEPRLPFWEVSNRVGVQFLELKARFYMSRLAALQQK